MLSTEEVIQLHKQHHAKFYSNSETISLGVTRRRGEDEGHSSVESKEGNKSADEQSHSLRAAPMCITTSDKTVDEDAWRHLAANWHCVQFEESKCENVKLVRADTTANTQVKGKGSKGNKRMESLAVSLTNLVLLPKVDVLQRVLLKNAPRMPYKAREGKFKSVQHWGQRKLFLSELEFLTQFSREGDVVVYAGAAPGYHLKYLIHLFPSLRFHLVDPRPFELKEYDYDGGKKYTKLSEHAETKQDDNSKCVIQKLSRPLSSMKSEKTSLLDQCDEIGQRRVAMHQCCFTDELAAQFKKLYEDEPNSILFISDIRTGSGDGQSRMSSPDFEKQVAQDQADQTRWNQLLNARWSMLKFRLPLGDFKSKAQEGFLWLPVWSRVQSSELRLVVSQGAEIVDWDREEIEEQCMYFHTLTRVSAHPHDVSIPGVDHCYDCSAEKQIWENYLLRYPFFFVKMYIRLCATKRRKQIREKVKKFAHIVKMKPLLREWNQVMQRLIDLKLMEGIESSYLQRKNDKGVKQIALCEGTEDALEENKEAYPLEIKAKNPRQAPKDVYSLVLGERNESDSPKDGQTGFASLTTSMKEQLNDCIGYLMGNLHLHINSPKSCRSLEDLYPPLPERNYTSINNNL